MSFGEGNLRERVAELERRVFELETLVYDLWPRAKHTMGAYNRESYEERMNELGLEVGDRELPDVTRPLCERAEVSS